MTLKNINSHLKVIIFLIHIFWDSLSLFRKAYLFLPWLEKQKKEIHYEGEVVSILSLTVIYISKAGILSHSPLQVCQQLCGAGAGMGVKAGVEDRECSS